MIANHTYIGVLIHWLFIGQTIKGAISDNINNVNTYSHKDNNIILFVIIVISYWQGKEFVLCSIMRVIIIQVYIVNFTYKQRLTVIVTEC